jgi:hypothetical protein
VRSRLICGVVGFALCATIAFGQEKRTLHVTKVTQSEWTQETTENGNTVSKRQFTIWAHDPKNDYEADCGEILVLSKDGKILTHFRCIQVESGEDYIATFHPGSLSIDCEDCTETETEKFTAYTIRSQEERVPK